MFHIQFTSHRDIVLINIYNKCSLYRNTRHIPATIKAEIPHAQTTNYKLEQFPPQISMIIQPVIISTPVVHRTHY